MQSLKIKGLQEGKAPFGGLGGAVRPGRTEEKIFRARRPVCKHVDPGALG